MELVASEPLIRDPVDMEIDELGNMYVVEMGGNPSNDSGVGKVKLLKDFDQDGVMDTSFLFADSFRMPGGVMRWKQGILVTDPPDVVYLQDTDGDNVADRRTVILTGFDSTDLESNVNNPYFGLDNWIYVGNGGRSGPGIHYTDKAGTTTLPDNANGQRVRFLPDSGRLEELSGQTQFGHTEDVAGHPLLVNNSNHIYEEVISSKYLNRNPNLLISSATESISDHSNRVFPTTVNPENQMLTDVGVFTAACGITAYTGGAFGPQYDSAVFVGEPAHNLVHVDLLSPSGATHVAKRMDSAREFLSSTDPWFRPVNFYVGPDGGLYVVDYYRQFIEGPEFMSQEVLKTADLYAGSDKGRIYKITKEGTGASSESITKDLADLKGWDLVKRLSDPNLWWRKTAQRLILERKDTTLVPTLVNLIHEHDLPLGRLHALWTLEGLNRLTPDLVVHSLHDTASFVRETAIRLADLHFMNNPLVTGELLKMADDPDSRVRFQLLCTIGGIQKPQSEKLIREMLFRYIDDPWMQVAALTSVSKDRFQIFQEAISKYKSDSRAYSLLVGRIVSMIVSAGTPREVYGILKQCIDKTKNNDDWRPAALRGISVALQGRQNIYASLDPHRRLLINSVLEDNSVELRDAALRVIQTIGMNQDMPGLEGLIKKASLIAADSVKDAPWRATAIRLIGLGDPSKYSKLLMQSIAGSEPPVVQLAAIRALSKVPGTKATDFILERWKTFTPDIQDEAINVFMFDRDRIALLLDAVAKGEIASSVIGWPRSVRLMAGRWPTPSNQLTKQDTVLIFKARSLLSRKDAPKKQLIAEYVASIGKPADKNRGKQIFIANCSICHQVNEKQGVKLGPDLSTVSNWDRAELVGKILDPNQSIKNGYELWDITLTNGESVQGLISGETPTAVTVNNNNVLPRMIARTDIKTITSSGMTLMPSGFEKQINKEEMACLLTYLKNE